MKAKNCTVQELQMALEIINHKYEGNIRFKRLDGGKTPQFTLTVNSSKAKGGRLGQHGRRIAAACWHVHGDFFDALLKVNPSAVITTAFARIDADGGNWQDKNIGSIMFPMYYSEACDC
jgi:hypothetical protein